MCSRPAGILSSRATGAQSSAILRYLLPPHRLSHTQVHLSSAPTRHPDDDRGLELVDVCLSALRACTRAVQLCARHSRRRVADLVASHFRDRRTALVGAGARQARGGARETMTRSTSARLAGVTYLLYIALAFPSMILYGGATRGVGTAAKLARIADHAGDVRVAIVLTMATCFVAIALAV